MRNLYEEIHKLFNSLERYHYPFDKKLKESSINGMYIMFEKNEKFKQFDRIVRVGIHNGRNRLANRLIEHYYKKNKDRSIFRKNIGRCFINKENKAYLHVWNKDYTSKIEKEKNLNIKDKDYEIYLETKISKYIQSNISFVLIKIENFEDRKFWEKKIIATLAQFNNISPSDKWLGYSSPSAKIRNHGLWQVNGLKSEQLNEFEYNSLIKLVNSSHNLF